MRRLSPQAENALRSDSFMASVHLSLIREFPSLSRHSSVSLPQHSPLSDILSCIQLFALCLSCYNADSLRVGAVVCFVRCCFPITEPTINRCSYMLEPPNAWVTQDAWMPRFTSGSVVSWHRTPWANTQHTIGPPGLPLSSSSVLLSHPPFHPPNQPATYCAADPAPPGALPAGKAHLFLGLTPCPLCSRPTTSVPSEEWPPTLH